MVIKFSRHSRRRMQLYGLPENLIIDAVERKQFSDSDKIVILEELNGFKYPVKIIAEKSGNDIVIITAYPMKRGSK